MVVAIRLYIFTIFINVGKLFNCLQITMYVFICSILYIVPIGHLQMYIRIRSIVHCL